MKWTTFPGVQSLIMKGLTLEATSEPSRELLSRFDTHTATTVYTCMYMYIVLAGIVWSL